MTRKIALFANHKPGIDVAKFFADNDLDTVQALYVPGESKENDQQIIQALHIDPSKVFMGKSIMNDPSHIAWFKEQRFSAIICVYWPWLLDKNIFSTVPITVNFHPAFLPVNRGWFPHVHSLIDGSRAGVTIHKIEDGADTGAVWAQKEVRIEPTDTAKAIYDRLQSEIVALFIEKWPDIISGKITPFPQNEKDAVYHKKSEIAGLDFLDVNSTMKVGDVINRLRARTFGERGFAFIEVDGKPVYLNLRLSEKNNFSL